MKGACKKCGRKYPWGISSADGVCFRCRWPAMWNDRDERHYQHRIDGMKGKPLPTKVLTDL